MTIEIDLGADFPLSPEQKKQREEVAQALSNALYCIQYDPIGGNALHEAERAVALMTRED